MDSPGIFTVPLPKLHPTPFQDTGAHTKACVPETWHGHLKRIHRMSRHLVIALACCIQLVAGLVSVGGAGPPWPWDVREIVQQVQVQSTRTSLGCNMPTERSARLAVDADCQDTSWFMPPSQVSSFLASCSTANLDES